MREWITYLNSSGSTASKDKILFGKWEDRRVNTLAVINRFRINNRIPEKVSIGEDEFTEWLYSLGYRREEQ